MKTTFGATDNDAPEKKEGPTAEDWIRLQQMDPAVEAAMLASLKDDTNTRVSKGPTAEDWIRVQGMDPEVERAMLQSLKQEAAAQNRASWGIVKALETPTYGAGPGATAEDWIRAQGMDPAVESAMLKTIKGEPATNQGTATAADWIRAQGMDPAVEKHMMESIYGKAQPKEAPAAVDSPKEPSKGAFVKGIIQKAFNFGSAKKTPAAAVVATAPVTTGVKHKAPGA